VAGRGNSFIGANPRLGRFQVTHAAYLEFLGDGAEPPRS
jgi:hypothetical protein